MKLYKFIKKNSDWTVVIVLLILLALGMLAYFWLQPSYNFTHTSIPRTYDPYSSPLYDKKVPNPNYPPPAKEQRSYYRTYDYGEYSYNIEKGVTNTSRDPVIGGSSFYVEWNNNTNKEVSVNFSFGCIAQVNPYRITPVESKQNTLAPFESRIDTIEVPAQCEYVGTSDNKYFWVL